MILNSNSSKSIWIYDESHCILDCLSPRSTLFPPNPLVEILRIWGQHKSVRLPDFGPWFHQSGDFVGILKPTDLLTSRLFWKVTPDEKRMDFRASKLPPRQRLQKKSVKTRQNMAFYDMCDIKSIYICNTCAFIYIYISYYIFHMLQTSSILQISYISYMLYSRCTYIHIYIYALNMHPILCLNKCMTYIRSTYDVKTYIDYDTKYIKIY